MMFARSALSSAALAALVLVASPCSFAADDAKKDKIAFTRMVLEDKKIGIVIMNADGTEQTRLTKGKDVAELDPVLSPDGKRIAFLVLDEKEKEGKKVGIYVMNADGSKRQRILESDEKSIPYGMAWSPDGKKIAYTVTKTGVNKPTEDAVMVMDADGKNSKLLADGVLPAWSPDGMKIIYTVTQKD